MNASDGPAIVTGAAGFIGSHLLTRLAHEGCAVTGLDSALPGRDRQPPDGVRLLRVDLREGAALRRAVEEVRPRVIFHLAAQASVVASMRDPAADLEANVLGTVHLAQASAECGVRRLVFFSTGGALYGEPPHIPVTEETPPAPQSVYGASKLAAEHYLHLITAAGPAISVLRPGNVYGPGQDAGGEAGVVAIFASRMLHDEPVTIFGDGSQRRDYGHVDDVVEAALLAATGEPATCLVGSGVGTSTIDIFTRLAALCEYRREPIFAAERPGDVRRIVLDASRARDLWGWSPAVGLDEGLAATVEWFRRAAG